MQATVGNANTHALEASLTGRHPADRLGAQRAGTPNLHVQKRPATGQHTLTVQVGAFPGVPRQRHGLLPQT